MKLTLILTLKVDLDTHTHSHCSLTSWTRDHLSANTLQISRFLPSCKVLSSFRMDTLFEILSLNENTNLRQIRLYFQKAQSKETLKVKSDHRSQFSNSSNWKQYAWKYLGLNGIRTLDLRDTGVMLDQLSCEATHWERGQFVEFISSRAVKWCEIYMEFIFVLRL